MSANWVDWEEQRDGILREARRQADEILREARKQADGTLKEAEETARAIYGYSLEYADDMLAEVELMVRREREAILEEIDLRLDRMEEHKAELLAYLRALSEDGDRPVRKASYDIHVDESYVPRKQSYEIRTGEAEGGKVEVRATKYPPYEIKVADEWKDRVEALASGDGESMAYGPLGEDIPLAEEEEEEEGAYKASDFDLDAEYFRWLEEEGKSHPGDEA